SRGGGRVIINRESPLAGEDLTIDCDISIEAADTGRATIVSDRDYAITARKKISLAGIRFGGAGALTFHAASPFEMRRSTVVSRALLVADQSIRLEGNEFADFGVNLSMGADDAAVTIRA